MIGSPNRSGTEVPVIHEVLPEIIALNSATRIAGAEHLFALPFKYSVYGDGRGMRMCTGPPRGT